MIFVNRQWEVGSEFHWQGMPKGPFIQWPEPHIFYSTGREALLGIVQILQKNFYRTLFVPDYFCDEVTTWWVANGITIKRYADGPHLNAPVLEKLTFSEGDAVLATNYFGVRDGNAWSSWQEANKGVFLIEDHSHDPVSAWALNSNADFAFASLRKTFPVPDGGILWSPKGIALPDEPSNDDWRGSALKLAAMILKKDYLEGDDQQLKKIFRDFQIKGERYLQGMPLVAISPWSKYTLASGYPIGWRVARENNVRTFLNLIQEKTFFKPLFNEWPVNHCPYNVVLVFTSKTIREDCLQNLINSNIYPAIHWRLNDASTPEARSFANRVMTIPVDHRYGEDDIKKVFNIITGMY